MTYQVLARKWRPRNFREMAGQGHVLKTLINSLDNDRLHHAYLFTGTRGVGKTTIARILARCLNCETGVTSEPCGQCSACKEIDEGRFIDLIEVDAASRTKVEDTRELLDNVQYSPTRGRYKVYLIDEVHMLSGHSFNALLKTLEEPPPHVKFLLATTDPQKLPVTVLSRCLQFNLKNISPERLVEHIKHILEAEKIPFEEPALWQLGRAAQGSVRDCLTLLDQAIGYCEGNITDTEVSGFLGTIDQSVIHELVDALASQDAARVLGIIESAADHAPDFSAVLADLQSYLHRVAIAQAVPEGIDNSQGDRDMVLAHAGKLPAEILQLYYQIALKGREDIPYAIDARAGLEMALLRMLAFMPASRADNTSHAAPATDATDTGETLKKKSSLSEQPPAETHSPEQHASVQHSSEKAAQQRQPQSRHSPVITETPVAVRQSSRTATAAHKPDPDKKQAGAQSSDSSDDISPNNQQAEKPASDKPEAAVDTGSCTDSDTDAGISADAKDYEFEDEDIEAVSLTELGPDTWIMLFRQLELVGITRSIAANCLLRSVQGNRISLVLDNSQTSVFNDEQQRRINSALNSYFNQAVELDITPAILADEKGETPALWRERKDRERLQAARQIFENDATVQAIVHTFSGAIQPDTIEPTTPKPY